MDEGKDVVERTLVIPASPAEVWLALTDPAVRVYPRSEEPGVKQVYTGHEGMFEYLGNWLSQWDDYETEPTSFQDAPADRVLVEMAERGHLKKTGITLDEPFAPYEYDAAILVGTDIPLLSRPMGRGILYD